MKHTIFKVLGGMILAGLFGVSAFADTNPALPGTVNYVEGKVALNDQTLNKQSVGTTSLETGQSIETSNGKTEVLLTPGVFARADTNSSLQLVSGSLTNTEVKLDRGAAMIEVDELHKENNLRVASNGAITALNKTGLYEFDVDHNQILVFKGEAEVQEGDRRQKVKGGHEVTLTDASLKSHGFDKDRVKNSDLYKFSSLRSQYISEASADAAQQYVGNAWAPGWFWDPWFSAYTFFPGDGFLYSPFGWGWGFYSPRYISWYGGPVYYRNGHAGRGYVAGRGHVGRNAPARTGTAHVASHASIGHVGGGFAGGGFHGGGVHR